MRRRWRFGVCVAAAWLAVGLALLGLWLRPDAGCALVGAHGGFSRRLDARPTRRGASPLDDEVLRKASALLPRVEDRKAKELLLELLQDIVEQQISPSAKIYGYGSSVTGCSEAQADVDAVIFNPAVEGEVTPWDTVLLTRVADMADENPHLSVVERRLSARIPILTVALLGEDGETTGYECDLNMHHMMPLFNSRLLRQYVKLAPHFPVLSVIVKRWAKANEIAKTFDGYISAYSWTLMVLYFLQVQHGLPSLHAIARQRPDFKPRRLGHFDTEFTVDSAEVYRFLEDSGSTWDSLEGHRLSELLRGFFEFYSTEYGWEREVVSTRLGVRCNRNDRRFSRKLGEVTVRRGADGTFGVGSWRTEELPFFLNIEDPCEVSRNLNFALREDEARAQIRRAVDDAHSLLSGGRRDEPGLLQELLQEDAEDSSGVLGCERELLDRWQDGCLPPPELESEEGVEPWRSRCPRCEKIFDSFMEMTTHEFAKVCKPPDPTLKCPVCDKPLRDIRSWESHSLATGHEGPPIPLGRPPGKRGAFKKSGGGAFRKPRPKGKGSPYAAPAAARAEADPPPPPPPPRRQAPPPPKGGAKTTPSEIVSF